MTSARTEAEILKQDTRGRVRVSAEPGSLRYKLRDEERQWERECMSIVDLRGASLHPIPSRFRRKTVRCSQQIRERVDGDDDLIQRAALFLCPDRVCGERDMEM